MKKIAILIVIAGLLLGGCNIVNEDRAEPTATPGPTVPEATPSPDPGKSDNILKDFLILVGDWENPGKLYEYISSHIGGASLDVSTRMILTLEEIQQSFEPYYQQLLMESDNLDDLHEASGNGLESNIVDRVDNNSLKSLLTDIFDNGYMLENREGDIYPVVDYSYVRNFSNYVSPMASEYFEIMTVHTVSPVAVDAEIVVPWDEIASRMLDIEAFLNTYPDFLRIQNLERMYGNYTKIYLYGLPNTPAYDNTGKYKETVIDSYNDLINENGSSATAKTVKEFLYILETHDNKISEAARNYPLPQVDNPEVFRYAYLNEALSSLLPFEERYNWSYFGFAEYGHGMTLDDIDISNNEYRYAITGRVADMSDGESGRPEKDFHIDISYVIKNASVIQQKEELRMMDSRFDSLELIRAPLVEGFRWLQTVEDENGDEVYLNCEITAVSEDDSKSYAVEYRDPDSGYYEKRIIEDGVGIVNFEKLWETQDESFEIGYSLNRDASGYK